MSEHLHYLRHNTKVPDPNRHEGERLFRRYKPDGIREPSKKFLSISKEDIAAGLSVNRSHYCGDQEHAKWSIADLDDNNHEAGCSYIDKEGEIAIALLSAFDCVYRIQMRNSKNETIVGAEVTITFVHDPIFCNYSHSLLVIDPYLNTKPERESLKIFLADIFCE